MREPTGPTGDFPRGKLNTDDKGEIRIGVAAHQGNVVIDFGTRVSWVGMPPEQAEQLADTPAHQSSGSEGRPVMKRAMPSLAERQQPGLSRTLHFFPNPEECQSCGCAGELTRWRECDEWDKPTAVVVVLCSKCSKCSKKLIDPHPRLYHQLQEHEPFAGSMQICLDCPMREGVSCTSPLAKSNGGPGMQIDAHGFGGFFCGSKAINGYHILYQRAPSACAGKEAAFQPQLVV